MINKKKRTKTFRGQTDQTDQEINTKNIIINPNITRRVLLGGAAAGVVLLSSNQSIAQEKGEEDFTHGVASGDPTANSIILWTRYVPPGTPSATISLEVALDNNFTNIIFQSQVYVDSKRDYTAKVDATGLEPSKIYFYRFYVGDTYSPTGRTKTLPKPESTAPFTLSLVSCSNYPQGLFHVYREIANSTTDLVLHLGDYIYEYGPGTYANEKAIQMGRQVKPAKEIVSLADYHQRYALYRSDPDLQAVHAQHPFICVWDDHETANDSWKDGAENHQPNEEGPYNSRKIAARQAWLDWLPVRETPDVLEGKIYRTFEIGKLASLIMLDTRIIGRDKPLNYQTDLTFKELPFDFSNPAAPVALLSKEALSKANPAAVKSIPVPFDLRNSQPTPVTDWATLQTLSPENLPEGFAYLPDLEKFKTEKLNDESRTILGDEQEKWLEAELERSVKAGKTWQLLGQQLLMGQLNVPLIAPSQIDFEKSKFITPENFAFFQLLAAKKMPLNLDAWDGYGANRDRVCDIIRRTKAKAISFAGDTHNAWGFEIADDKGPVAVEIGTPGVSSPGLESYLPIETTIVDTALKNASPELKYINSHQRGWADITLSADQTLIDWKFVSSVLDTTYSVMRENPYEIKAISSTKLTRIER